MAFLSRLLQVNTHCPWEPCLPAAPTSQSLPEAPSRIAFSGCTTAGSSEVGVGTLCSIQTSLCLGSGLELMSAWKALAC